MVVDACAALIKRIVLGDSENKVGGQGSGEGRVDMMEGWLGSLKKTISVVNGKGKGKDKERILVVVG